MKLLSITVIMTMIAAIAISSCGDRPDIVGSWSGMPSRIDGISAASNADATISITFFADDNSDNDSGSLMISALIDADQPVSGPESFNNSPYEVSVAATATIKGNWTFEDHEDDDVLITLDPNTLAVNVDPNGVTFSSDILTGTQQPQLDSLTTATADMWKQSIAKSIGNSFYNIRKISDIKIKNGIMSCEINDRDITFRKTE